MLYIEKTFSAHEMSIRNILKDVPAHFKVYVTERSGSNKNERVIVTAICGETELAIKSDFYKPSNFKSKRACVVNSVKNMNSLILKIINNGKSN